MKQLNYISPYQRLLKRSPEYRFLKTFGCLCFPYLGTYNSHKLMPKSKPCVFLGYDNIRKGYRCFDNEMGRLFISRNVLFDEKCFPLTKQQQPPGPANPCLARGSTYQAQRTLLLLYSIQTPSTGSTFSNNGCHSTPL